VHFFPSLDYLQLLVDEQTGHTHTSANAHGGEQDLGLAASAFAQTCDDLPCTGATERVALEIRMLTMSRESRYRTNEGNSPMRWHHL
jgi:hypothetical protein